LKGWLLGGLGSRVSWLRGLCVQKYCGPQATLVFQEIRKFAKNGEKSTKMANFRLKRPILTAFSSKTESAVFFENRGFCAKPGLFTR
jgi:hypothetical protein